MNYDIIVWLDYEVYIMKEIDYKEKLLLDEAYLSEEEKLQRIVLSKNRTNVRDTFQLYSYLVNSYSSECLQGYMYFNICPLNNSSNYIGTYVNPEFRRGGIAQLLNAYWIRFCLENDIVNLKTIKRQRKPFLVYMLKKYSFEVANISQYEGRSIHICKKNEGEKKALLFDSSLQKELFLTGKIYRDDNYCILDSLGEYEKIDKVLLNHTYYIEDTDKAYQKSLSIRKK